MKISAQIFLRKGNFTLDVTLDSPLSGVTTIMGPSGCGKTTLLRTIAGLEPCRQCKIIVNQQVWQDENVFVPTHQRALGYVFQESLLFSHLSVRGNIEFGYKRVSESQRTLNFENVIEGLGLHNLLDRSVIHLSGGEKQRVAIARALLTSPKLILMDEPLSAIDQQSKQELYPFLESLYQKFNIPIFYVSHTINEVARLADQVIVMDNGSIRGVGPVQAVFSRLDLPLAHYADAESLIDAIVTNHDEHYNLTYLRCNAGELTVPRIRKNIDNVVRVHILARDVSITLQKQVDTSILNCFTAVVAEIVEENRAQVTVKLLANGVPIISRITRKSADLLSLKPGKEVFVQVKSVAVLA